MKIFLTDGVALQPVTSQLDFSGCVHFDVRRLIGVIHVPSTTLIYAAGRSGRGYVELSANGRILTLAQSLVNFGALDLLTVIYDHADRPVAFVSDVVPTELAVGAGLLSGYDLFNATTLARVVSFYDTAAAPVASDQPFLTVVLGGGSGRAFALPSGRPFSNGLWTTTTARRSDAVAAGDVSGSIIL